MPNLNFTSSSFAQQDRYAQTTVSYESRNMQNIPFYPGVDHKAKLRGIFALTLVVTVIVGAVLGTLFGLRDHIINWWEQTPVYSAINGDDNTPPPTDEEMNVAPSASISTEYVVINPDPGNGNVGKPTKDVVYNGLEQAIEWGVSVESPYTRADVAVAFTWQKLSGDVPHDPDVDGWPINAGSYLVKAFISINGQSAGEKHVTLNIAKATIPYPGIKLPDDRIYDGNTKVIEIIDTLPADYSAGYKIVDTASRKELNVNKAGTYNLSVRIVGDSNYEEKFYDAGTLTIEKKKVLASEFDDFFKDKVVTYNGNVHTIELDYNNLPDELKNLKDEIKGNPEILTYAKEVENPTDARISPYIIRALIDSNNYQIVGSIEANLTIEPALLTDFFTFKDVNTVYSGNMISKNYLEIIKDANFPDEVAQNISIKYTYYDESGKTITAAEIENAGTYTVIAKFATGHNYVTPDDIEITIFVDKAKIDTSKVVVTPVVKDYGKSDKINQSSISGLPVGVKAVIPSKQPSNAGEHEITITLTGDNYYEAKVVGKITINKALSESLYTTAKPIQSVTKDGSVHYPKLDYIPDGAVVEYFVGGKSMNEGFTKLGTYKVDIVVSNDNEYYTVPVTYTVNFNFLTIIMGIIVGVIAAFIIAPLILLSHRVIEKRSFKKFARLRARILHERGGARGAIVCEGRVTIMNWNSEQEIRDFPWTIIEPRFGRLYLTHATLEYYDADYKKNYRNFLVQLKDVTGVEIRGVFLRNKLIVFAKGGRHVFYVEPNTAYLWRRDIIHFRNLQHLYPMENNVVDNDYPFNYTVITDGD